MVEPRVEMWGGLMVAWWAVSLVGNLVVVLVEVMVEQRAARTVVELVVMTAE